MDKKILSFILGISILLLIPNLILADDVPSDSSTSYSTTCYDGSIRVCKIIIDSEGNIVTGSDLPGEVFTIPGIFPDPEPSTGDPVGVISDSVFTTPITLNKDLFGSDNYDARCVKYSDLSLGGYYYGEESYPDGEWRTPLYNDQFNTPVTGLEDFFPYDDNLFDDYDDNDGDRNKNSDGYIFLTYDVHERTLVVLNRYGDTCEILIGDFCSQTQGGWGSACNGGNAGCLRNDYWNVVTGGTLVVGTGYTLTFTSSSAVENFLPQGSPPEPLITSYVNPTDSHISVFSGQVTALKLNVMFSDAGIGLHDPNSDTPLGELIINQDKFEGMTVYEFLALAEEVLGGNTSRLGDFSAEMDDINTAASKINENFDDCREDQGYLDLYCPSDLCGNEILDEGEQCDYGINNGDVCSPPYEGSCQWCTSECTLEEEPGPYCGDGTLFDDYEQCDDSNNANGDGCNEFCELEYCGDGTVNDIDEICDLGPDNGAGCDPPYDGTCQWCSDTCEDREEQGPYCGDGILQDTYEECDGDLGVPDNYVCTDSCTLEYVPFCGDGNPDSGEQCDYGIDNGVVCDPPYDGTCQWCSDTCEDREEQGPYCGDGIKQDPYEECDNIDSVPEHYFCTSECTLEYIPYCSDGIVQEPEQCELPGTDGNIYCDQTIETCEDGGAKFGTRDAYGSCDLACGCVEDGFVYTCIEGLCGAVCDESTDYDQVDNTCYFGCDSDETCSFESSCSIESYCDDDLYFFEGTCTGDGCGFTQQDCSDLDYTEDPVLACDGSSIVEVTVSHFFSCIEGCTEVGGGAGAILIEDCDTHDGWYDTGETRLVDTSQCTEKEQREQEYRDYTCYDYGTAECDYTVTNMRWIDTGESGDKPDGTVCNDGLFCTTGDVCGQGVCGGQERVCEGDQCGIGFCNEELDICDIEPLDYGTSCEADGNLCTIDVCDGEGVCVGEEIIECVDAQCSIGTCNPSTGACDNEYKPEGTLCSDEQYCNGPEICNAFGSCVTIGVPVVCHDGDVCTDDYCDENLDSCVYEPVGDEHPPETVKIYGEPLVTNGTSEWITSSTEITLNGNDSPVCPVGEITTYYRVTLVDDENCYDQTLCMELDGDGDYETYYKPFTIPEDSCHLIEFRSEDSTGNAEEKHQQCAFVDNTPPGRSAQTGNPKIACEDESCDWFISTETTIHLNCWDQQPHPVGGETIYWRWRLDQGNWTEWHHGETGEDLDITFDEDSFHEIEYWCEDALHNAYDPLTKIYKVDAQPPEITKVIGDPHVGCETSQDICFVSQETPIEVIAEDREPHPVNDVSLTCEWWWGSILYFDNDLGDMDGDNDTDKYDVDYLINYTFIGGPEPFSLERADLNDDDEINALDVAILIDMVYINGYQELFIVNGSFTYTEDSNHLLHCWAEDALGNREDFWESDIVDTQPPEPIKTVGEPRELWDGTDAIFYDLEEFCETPGNCWKVSTFTPITLSCNDPEPHPVGNMKMCFKVEWDGDDITDENQDINHGGYCELYGGEMNDNGYCCILQDEEPTEFYFTEVSEHNLEYYCEDKLGNVGPVDDEKFKVGHKSFKIKLNKKWNLISVPFALLDPSVESVFDGVADDIESVWTYDAITGEWYIYTPDGVDNDNLETIQPGWGYWVLANNDTEILGGNIFSPTEEPPGKELVPGWNLIGYYGIKSYSGEDILEYNGPVGAGDTAICALGSLSDTESGAPLWGALFTYWELDNPELWTFLDYESRMDPGAGYWVEIDANRTYVPSGGCAKAI